MPNEPGRLRGVIIDGRALICAGAAAGSGLYVGWGGTRWHTSPSMRAFGQVGAPWWSIGATFIVTAVLIMVPVVRPLGYALGAALFGTFAWYLDRTAFPPSDRVANAPATFALMGFALVQAIGVITALSDRVTHGRRQ
jgi:hypothetical protein